MDKSAPERVDLVEVIERSVRRVVQSAPARFAVDIDLSPGLEHAIPSGQLQQVVPKLVQNAREKGDSTGS